MGNLNGKSKPDVTLIQLLPNMLTIGAICAGMTAIRFAHAGNFELAVKLILAACVLDGVDGRLARALGGESALGAELDSLADFLNFGVAPPLLIHFWALHDMRSGGWIAVLIFAVCCVLRLARFNIGGKCEPGTTPPPYFIGVPAPAGALLALLPMFVSFAFADAPLLPDPLMALYLIFVGVLMVSTIPTWSLKAARISRANAKLLLVLFAFVGAATLTFLWETLVAICLCYVALVLWNLPKLAALKKEN